MIAINKNDFIAMSFNSEFESYAKSKGIRNPFQVSMRAFKNRCHKNEDGSTSIDIEFDENGKIKADPAEPSQEERDTYIRMRNEYIARRCFEEIGYDMFLGCTAPGETYDISYMRNMEEFVPCRSADRQCTLECYKYAECALQDAYSLDYKIGGPETA